MAYLTVTTAIDVVDPADGRLSLREAVAQANAGAAADTIRFIAALEGKTLVLTGGELAVDRDLTINGDANGDGTQVTIDGGWKGRILNISGTGTVVRAVSQSSPSPIESGSTSGLVSMVPDS